jgi:hypothetical protein
MPPFAADRPSGAIRRRAKTIAWSFVALVLLGLSLMTPVLQEPQRQPMNKPLSPELERIIEAMPPSARATVRHMLETDPAMRRRAELSEKQMAEKRPHWTREGVLRKIAVVFPENDPAQILALLDSVVVDGGGPRVQLAIVKLCDEGKGLPDLAQYVKAATEDLRDVLAWAESPSYIRLPASASDSEREEAGKRDLEQYLRWIEQDRKGKG